MDKVEKKNKKNEFTKLFLSSKYTQKEIAEKLGISEQTICEWARSIPALKYDKIRSNLATEVEVLSRSPKGNEDLIFKYIDYLERIDTMIRKAKFLPEM